MGKELIMPIPTSLSSTVANSSTNFSVVIVRSVLTTNHNINYLQELITVESRKYTPLFCILVSGKTGERAYARDHDISVWRPLLTDDWMGFKGLSINIARFCSQSRTGGVGAYSVTNTCAGTLAKNGRGAYTREGAYSWDTTAKQKGG